MKTSMNKRERNKGIIKIAKRHQSRLFREALFRDGMYVLSPSQFKVLQETSKYMSFCGDKTQVAHTYSEKECYSPKFFYKEHRVKVDPKLDEVNEKPDPIRESMYALRWA